MSTEPLPTILVVDDDVENRHNLTDILTDLGYQVDTAPDGPTGLAMIEERPYDVALLDYKMPGMTGLELYYEIKATRAGTVAVLVSAYADPTTRDMALRAGVWRVLPKPVDPTRLVELVGEAVEQPLLMVVDDDTELRTTLWDILRDRGFRVCLAGDADTAAKRIEERCYQVVVVDLRLPDADGNDVVKEIHRSAPSAKTVVITGESESSPLVQETLEAQVDAVYHKPLDVSRLLETLERLARQ